jgi:hypothetical protein
MRVRMLKNLLIPCVVLFSAAAAFPFDMNVKSAVSASQIFVGDRFIYTITVDAPADARVDLPSFVGNLGNFEVKDMKNDRTTDGVPEGRAKFTWTATLNTFVGGDFLIAPQEVEAVVGKDSVVTHTDPVAVKVASRTNGQESDIMDVEPPMKDPRMPVWFWWIVAVLGAGALVFLGWYLHKKFRGRGAAPALPPYEEAVLALKEMREKNLLAAGDQAEYFAQISFIARRYIQRRFGVDILDATVQQLKQRMAHVAHLQQGYKESVVTLELETEPVKFAKMKLPMDRCDYWSAWADRLLEDTKPTPEEIQAKAMEKEALTKKKKSGKKSDARNAQAQKPAAVKTPETDAEKGKDAERLNSEAETAVEELLGKRQEGKMPSDFAPQPRKNFGGIFEDDPDKEKR